MKTERLFVLRVIKYGEADLIVSGLNAMGSKIPLFAKAALKSRKRFGGGVLEPTHYIEATYCSPSQSFRGKNSLLIQLHDPKKEETYNKDYELQRYQKLYRLREATLQKDFRKIRQNYTRLQLGLHMLQLVDQFCHEGLLDNGQVFHLLGNALTALEVSKNLNRLQMAFELRLLKLQGILEEDHLMQSVFCQPISEHEDLKLTSIEEIVLKKSIKEHFQTHLFT